MDLLQTSNMASTVTINILDAQLLAEACTVAQEHVTEASRESDCLGLQAMAAFFKALVLVGAMQGTTVESVELREFLDELDMAHLIDRSP